MPGYFYDDEGRICAVVSSTGMTGYLYDADGNRIAKGTIGTVPSLVSSSNPYGLSCDPSVNGFQLTNSYALDAAGNQMSEYVTGSDGNLDWHHTNVWAGGKLLATYETAAAGPPANGATLHFYLDDPLGTRRVQTDYAGVIEQTCSSLPFGDGETCTPTPTEHLFTGKERDAESGNDYFGARYYASSIGRFLSPDWSAKAEPVPYAKLEDPQSLNLFAYVRNNPLISIDADGHFNGCGNGDVSDLCNIEPSPYNYGEVVEYNGGQAPQQNDNGQNDNGAQQQMGDPTLPTEVQPPPPSTADRLMSALMPKSPLDLALLVGTDGLGELGGAALRVLELAGEAGKTADYATIAVTETKEGLSIVSSSEARGLRPAVQAALKPGEVAVKGVGHAEVTGVNAARQMGLTPTGVAASRGICPSCADFLRTAGVAALSALKAILP